MSNCDLTLGRLEPCKDAVGGLKAVYFINYGDMDGLTYDVTDTDAIDELFGAATTSDVYKYDLKGTSTLDETITSSRENGTTFVEQVLTLSLKKRDVASHKELMVMAHGRPHIVVEDNNGTAWLVGVEHGAELTGTTSTGAALGDFNGYQLTLTASEKKPANAILGAVAGDPFAGMANQPASIVAGV